MQSFFKPLASKQLNKKLTGSLLRPFSRKAKNPGLLAKYQIESDCMIRATFSNFGKGDQSNLKHHKCLIPISIGQQTQYGAYLAATLSLINAHFGSCVFIKADSLQGYTKRIFYPDVSLEELKASARKEGRYWFNKNHLLFSELTIPWKMYCWDNVLDHPDFAYYLNVIKNTYHTNPIFKEACDESVMEYLKRNPNYPVEPEKAKALGLEYIWIECNYLLLIGQDCQWEVYPNGRKHALKAAHDIFIKPNHPERLQSISLRFKKIQNYQLQPEHEIKIYEHGNGSCLRTF